jgi:rsbT co-antagonist protein RsbR
MSMGVGTTPDARITLIRDMVVRIAAGDLVMRGSLSGQDDELDQIITDLNRIADHMMQQQEIQTRTEQHSQAILEVMFAAATQEYTQRAPVGDGDTMLDVLATGLNMLLDELVSSQEATARLQAENIRAQEAVIQELSTPLIPISDAVLVMPLIGTVDSRRAQQILERLLTGASEHQAHTIILDITGVTVVDTQVADALLRAARAVLLLGTQMILTGIRPEVAQLLVGLGVELRDIETRSTLQAGIAYATQMGERRRSR